MANKYFLTGATGAIGSALVPMLLQESDSKIWALIRAESDEHLNQRLEELILFWEMDADRAADARQRIVPVLGDADQEKFAMSDEWYSLIVRECTHIIHCAGVVRMNLPLEIARQHALGAVKNIVELAIDCQETGLLKKVEYVSTVGVAGKMSGLVQETWISQPRTFHNTYEQSKAEAEDYLAEKIQQHHLPVTVHRPSMVVGDSKTGRIIHFQIFYYLCEFISGRKTYGILPNLGNAILDTVPVDYVAQAIKWSSGNNPCEDGNILHLCSGHQESSRLEDIRLNVIARINEYGIPVRVNINLPVFLFVFIFGLVKLMASEKLRRSLSAVPVFLDYMQDQQIFSNQITVRYFEKHKGPSFISPNKYLTKVIDAYLVAKYVS